MKVTSIIRDRGQLTIPDSIRKVISWINPMSAVTISVVKPDEIIIKPHAKVIDKKRIWENVKKARAIKGKDTTTSAVDFLIKDRQSH
jgi:bifunctional DNA-binding transcriptional regulator/antitoxin component of YhaV-PrlF toxin-antitoxin module